MSGRMMIMALSGVAMVAISSSAQASEATVVRPELFQKLLDCRTIVDKNARLACFDTQIAQLDDAESKNEIVIVDKAQVTKAKRTLFGLTLPNLSILGERKLGERKDVKKTDTDEFSEIESKVNSAYQNKAGKWVIIIEDGARWVQTDSRSLNTPKVGQPIRIRRAALGSFLANVNKQIAIRVRREN